MQEESKINFKLSSKSTKINQTSNEEMVEKYDTIRGQLA